MKRFSRAFSLSTALVGLTLLLVAGCTNESNSVPTAAQSNIYLQVDRLGRPGIKEVFEPFADHNATDRAVPQNDQILLTDITSFPATSGGSTGAAAAAILWPDVLRMNLSASGSASYLANELTSGGFGGRALNDDVMSTDLSIAYGSRLSGTTATKPCLTTDNVSAPPATTTASATFPYLAAPQ
jgi:hypothetical protein